MKSVNTAQALRIVSGMYYMPNKVLTTVTTIIIILSQDKSRMNIIIINITYNNNRILFISHFALYFQKYLPHAPILWTGKVIISTSQTRNLSCFEYSLSSAIFCRVHTYRTPGFWLQKWGRQTHEHGKKPKLGGRKGLSLSPLMSH